MIRPVVLGRGVIARAGRGRPFASFGPYVPAISEGRVAFSATTHDGESGVVVVAPDGALSRPLGVLTPTSHPDIAGEYTTVYAGYPRAGVFVAPADGAGPGVAVRTAGVGGLVHVGPTGPTLNAAGVVAFRASTGPGHEGIYTAGPADGWAACCITQTPDWAGFEGLPVLNTRGTVLVRARAHDGGAALIRVREGRAPEVLLRTDEQWTMIGRFPSIDDADRVVFVAERWGRPTLARLGGEGIVPLLADNAGFVSLRGAICTGRGRVVFFGQRAGESLSVYALGPGGASRLLGLGDPGAGLGLGGQSGELSVVDLALNPVSIEDHGGGLSVVLRLGLRARDGAEEGAIVRLDLGGVT